MSLSSLKTLFPLLLVTLAGCSSGNSEQQKIEAIAKHRADILAADLPIEHGPLKVIQSRSHANTVELVMLYNGEKPAAELVNSSVKFYCNNSEIRSNLDLGVEYQITMRNARGKLLVSQHISADSCSDVK
ncbi:hypothetical protein DI392_07580 [Vibrio albus]|uniref:Type II secretion system pilot lipoprotein GspS-beta n=1 Tax=Vibrio albus TaxID=2200953 RepID=A0A2U3BB85_9VIBR|nr:type II secretion system pilot lipoprotein GspS-beta [Vibrio albus]PWI34051.1 hypothetical protein DI392_07580 [Vibrio albus]